MTLCACLWGGAAWLTYGEPLPCRVGPLLTTENLEAQRWAGVGPAAVGSPVRSVAGPLPLCNPEFGLYAAPEGEMVGLRRRGTGCLEAGPRAGLLSSLPHANHRPCQHVPVWGASDMRLHPVRRQRRWGAVLQTSGLQSRDTPSASARCRAGAPGVAVSTHGRAHAYTHWCAHVDTDCHNHLAGTHLDMHTRAHAHLLTRKHTPC